MIRAAALLLAMVSIAGGAAADGFFEVDRFDVTGVLPDGFGPAVPSDNVDGYTYDSLDGAAQLVVFGSHDLFGGLHPAREITRQGLLLEEATITYKFANDAAYAYSGIRLDGDIYYHYSRLGGTCDGVAVFGSFVLAYDPAFAATYDPMIQGLIDGLHIGACG